MAQKALFMNSFEMSKMVSLDVSETEDCLHNINLKYQILFLKIILTKYYVRKVKYKAYFSVYTMNLYLFQSLSSVQLLSRLQLFATPGITARQASLSITNSQSSLRLMSIESVMPSSHLILCCPLLLLPPIPPSIRVLSNESTLRMRWPKYWHFSFNIMTVYNGHFSVSSPHGKKGSENLNSSQGEEVLKGGNKIQTLFFRTIPLILLHCYTCHLPTVKAQMEKV